MKNFYGMTKEELIARCRNLQSENERLQDELDRLSDCYTEMENDLADKINSLDCVDSIKDMDYFKYRLELDGLLTPQLESFIEDYLKYYNIMKG
jgi:predicted nuclease with TOPRIM domain